MPIYTFRCRKCAEEIQVEHPMSALHPARHEGCGGELGRIFDSQTEVIYKTTGFTRTDRRFEANPKDH